MPDLAELLAPTGTQVRVRPEMVERLLSQGWSTVDPKPQRPVRRTRQRNTSRHPGERR